MLKTIMGSAATFALVLGISSAAEAKTKEIWMLGGFSRLGSVDLDIPHQVFYVSNLGGAPLDKDGNGFISKVSRDGKLLQLKWIEGLIPPRAW